MTITEFLLARITEDETAALAAVDGQADPENGWGYEGRTLIPHVGIIHHAVQAEHITRWHPYRVVAECAAKRAIVERYVDNLDLALSYRNPKWRDAMNDQDRIEHRMQEARAATSLEACVALAAIYADHPDYQTDWKLDTPSEAG